MGAAGSGLLSHCCHCVTQRAARPSSILTISSRAAEYGRPSSPRHVRPPSAIMEWHLADSSAGRRRPTSRCNWGARTACGKTAARSYSGSTIIRGACSRRGGSTRPDVASKSIASSAYNTSPSCQCNLEAHETRSAASC